MIYQREMWSDFIVSAGHLLPKHWEELALNKDKVPLDPNYEVYEKADNLLIITIRNNSDLLGYFIGFIAPGLHYKTCLTLLGDIFYIDPDYRAKGLGWRLFKEVEAAAKKEGVQRMFVGSKMHKDVSYLFEKLGYNEVERYWSTWLGE